MKWLAMIASVIIILYGCNSGQQQESSPVAGKDSLIKKAETSLRRKSHIDTVFSNADTIITSESNGYMDTLLRFRSRMRDGQFAVKENFKGKPVRLDYSTYTQARRFRTAITTYVKEQEMNFAGHYILAVWGCGVPCSESVVVDLKTGKVYEGLTACYGYTTSPQSKVIVLNPPDDDGEWYSKNRICGEPEEYVWTGTKLVKLEKK